MIHLGDSMGITRCLTLAGSVCLLERGHVRAGPRVDEGVLFNQVLRLEDDLSLALAVSPLRIQAPIPGMSAARAREDT